jgi:hypothetical protein
MNVQDAKELIIEELQRLEDQNKRPRVKIKYLYKGNNHWSKAFFQAGKELERKNEDIDMFIKAGFHHVEITN